MGLSISFRHNATMEIKIGWFGSMLFDLQTKTPVSKILYACLASNTMICVHNCKESLSTQIISQLWQVFCGILKSCRLRCSAFKLFLLFEELFDAKVLLIGHAVTQNYVSVVFQSEASKNNFNDYLIRHVKETIVMKMIMQFRTNVNYMAYISDCWIEICNTHTTTFDYPTHFSHNLPSSYN